MAEAGVEVWTPKHIVRRPVPGAKPNMSGQRPMQDLDAPILPTFVFARAAQVTALEAIEADQGNPHVASPHPPFSIMRHHGRVPFLREGEIAGLQKEEARAAGVRQAMRDAASAEEARRIRIEAMKDAAARRRATKAMERDRRLRLAGQRAGVKAGTSVEVEEMPAFAGVTGVVESNDGTTAHVRFGAHSWKIDSWRLSPADPASRGVAA